MVELLAEYNSAIEQITNLAYDLPHIRRPFPSSCIKLSFVGPRPAWDNRQPGSGGLCLAEFRLDSFSHQSVPCADEPSADLPAACSSLFIGIAIPRTSAVDLSTGRRLEL